MPNSNEVIQAQHALNDKLLHLRSSARRLGERLIGGLPPRGMPSVPAAPPSQALVVPPFLDEVFNTSSANRDLVDDLQYIIDSISATFDIVPEDEPGSTVAYR